MNRQSGKIVLACWSLVLAVACVESSRGDTVTSSGGTGGKIAKFTGTYTIGDSVVYESSGKIGVGTGSPTDVLTISNGGLNIWGGSTSAERASFFSHGTQHYLGIRSYSETSGTKLPIKLQQGNPSEVLDRLVITADGYVGIGTSSPTEKLTVSGNTTLSGDVTVCGNIVIKDGSTVVMELGSGLDYAEGFEVAGKDKPAPGSVLVIDAANPEQLATSSTPYDSRVAGIVAGAKNLGSGVRLGVGQFDCDVAMAGRVYCNVDATDGAVQPGDLLTTSATPGFAMKATDRARTPGAVLGKAMQGLEKGQKGQILVLVTLQ